MKENRPLVSIMIPNKDHAGFLGQCIESALNQTYTNTEIVVLDNCSSDNSIEVASKYIGKNVRVCKNPHNIINNSYKVLSLLTEGKYMMLLCADDLIKPAFLEKTVSLLERYPDAGYVHCERDYIDVNDCVTELDPFYNCSFIAPGESALPIYMLTDVAQPAQCLIRRSVFKEALGYNTEFDHTNADKELWFKLSLLSDYAYIREKLSLIRIHEARETNLGFKKFFHPLAMYLSLDSQAKRGELKGHENVAKRLPVAYRRLASESVQIALTCLKENDRKLAGKYLLFSRIIDGEMVNDEKYKEVFEFLHGHEEKHRGLPIESEHIFVSRKRNYDPPEGFFEIEV